MTSRRDIEARLDLYQEVAGILGAMRSFALTELRLVLRRQPAQQQIVHTLRLALQDLAPALPPPQHAATDVWILVGSSRGFCGSLNEDLARHWRAHRGDACPTVAVGERLGRLLPAAPTVSRLRGATGALDAPQAMDHIIEQLTLARAGGAVKPGLVVCLHGGDAVRTERLLPLPITLPCAGRPLPLTNEPADAVATGVAEHYLFHALLDLLLQAIQAENHLRLMQMEHALRHVERSTEELQRQRSRLRQEEIVEEIELLVQKRSRGDGTTRFRL